MFPANWPWPWPWPNRVHKHGWVQPILLIVPVNCSARPHPCFCQFAALKLRCFLLHPPFSSSVVHIIDCVLTFFLSPWSMAPPPFPSFLWLQVKVLQKSYIVRSDETSCFGPIYLAPNSTPFPNRPGHDYICTSVPAIFNSGKLLG